MELPSWPFLQCVVCPKPRVCPKVALCWFICAIERVIVVLWQNEYGQYNHSSELYGVSEQGSDCSRLSTPVMLVDTHTATMNPQLADQQKHREINLSSVHSNHMVVLGFESRQYHSRAHALNCGVRFRLHRGCNIYRMCELTCINPR